MRSGGCAGSGRALRLDPFGLPVRFLRRAMRPPTGECARSNFIASVLCCGARCAACAWRSICRVAAYDGVSLWLVPGEEGGEDALAVVLKHHDPALSLPLFVSPRRRRGAGRMASLEPRCSACRSCLRNSGGLSQLRARNSGSFRSSVRVRAAADGAPESAAGPQFSCDAEAAR